MSATLFTTLVIFMFFIGTASAEKPGGSAAGWIGATSAVSVGGAGPVTHTRLCAAEFGPKAHVCTSQEIHDYAAQLTSPGGWITATQITDGGRDTVSGFGGFVGSGCTTHATWSSTQQGLRIFVDEDFPGGPTRTGIYTDVCSNENPVACCSD